jgi:hypothetical protein
LQKGARARDARRWGCRYGKRVECRAPVAPLFTGDRKGDQSCA